MGKKAESDAPKRVMLVERLSRVVAAFPHPVREAAEEALTRLAHEHMRQHPGSRSSSLEEAAAAVAKGVRAQLAERAAAVGQERADNDEREWHPTEFVRAVNLFLELHAHKRAANLASSTFWQRSVGSFKNCTTLDLKVLYVRLFPLLRSGDVSALTDAQKAKLMKEPSFTLPFETVIGMKTKRKAQDDPDASQPKAKKQKTAEGEGKGKGKGKEAEGQGTQPKGKGKGAQGAKEDKGNGKGDQKEKGKGKEEEKGKGKGAEGGLPQSPVPQTPGNSTTPKKRRRRKGGSTPGSPPLLPTSPLLPASPLPASPKPATPAPLTPLPASPLPAAENPSAKGKGKAKAKEKKEAAKGKGKHAKREPSPHPESGEEGTHEEEREEEEEEDDDEDSEDAGQRSRAMAKKRPGTPAATRAANRKKKTRGN